MVDEDCEGEVEEGEGCGVEGDVEVGRQRGWVGGFRRRKVKGGGECAICV